VTAVRVASWSLLAAGMILVELRWGRRRPLEADDAARLTDRLMVIATGLALLGGVVGPLVLPPLPIPAALAATAGLAAGASGLLLRATAMRTLGRHYTLTPVVLSGHRLVTSGPYRLVRHPGYAGIVLYLFGLALLPGSLISVAFMLPLVALLPLRIQIEERQLADHFGAEYRRYARRTPYRLVFGLV
jgi:protein-S-isoprenylcysteine O-methyltransferase